MSSAQQNAMDAGFPGLVLIVGQTLNQIAPAFALNPESLKYGRQVIRN